MTDLLIDTNILMHANNDHERSQRMCIDLINYLLSSTENLCVDEDLDINKSLILHEYFDKLRTPDTTGRSFIIRLLQQKRVTPIPRKCEQRVTKIINQHINRDKHVDKVFVKITHKSNDKIFVSHDFEDFQIPKREYFKTTLDISIVSAEEILTVINDQ
jgi:hypothetical protein